MRHILWQHAGLIQTLFLLLIHPEAQPGKENGMVDEKLAILNVGFPQQGGNSTWVTLFYIEKLELIFFWTRLHEAKLENIMFPKFPHYKQGWEIKAISTNSN